MNDHWGQRAHARNSDPITSLEAADSVRDITGAQQKVLEAFQRHGPMTDEQLIALGLGLSPSGTRSRRAELVDRRLLRDSGVTTLTASKRKTIIWELAS